MQEGGSLAVGQYQSSPTVEVVVYDFGAVTITYRFRLDGPFEGLLKLSESLYENEPLLTESRKRVEQLLQAIHPSIERPKIAREVEDYIVFSIESYSPAQALPVWTSRETELAQVLRGERMPLADQEINGVMQGIVETLDCKIRSCTMGAGEVKRPSWCRWFTPARVVGISLR